MATIHPARITLSQNKLFTGTRFAVQQRVTTATPATLLNCFVMQPSSGLDLDRFVRVATLADINNVALLTNPLQYLARTSHTFPGVAVNDELRIYNYPGEWGAADGQDSTGPHKSFTVIGVSGGRVRISGFFWSRYSPNAVRYAFYRNNVWIGDSTNGRLERLDPSATLFKTNVCVSAYDVAAETLDHTLYVQTYVKALAVAAGLSPAEFLAYPPGNPITTTFES